MRKRSVGISLQYVNTALSMLSGLFLSAFLLRELGDTEYGLYQTISSFVNYLVLLEFGTGTVISRNIVSSRAKNNQIGIQRSVSTVWSITCILAVFILAVGFVFYGLIDEIYSRTLTHNQIIYGKQIFLVMLGFLIVSFYSNMMNGILMGFERYEVQPIIAIIKILSRTFLIVGFVIATHKSIIIALVDCFIAIVVDIFLIVYCHSRLNVRFQFKDFDVGIFKNSLPLAMAIFIQVLVNQANNSVDKFVIGIKLGPEDVAVYSVGLFVYSIFSSLTTTPVSMYGPQVVKEITNGLSPNEVSKHIIQPSRLIVFIGGAVLFGFFAVGKQFVTLVYGSSYLLAWKVALIIMTPMLINMSNGIMINILDATNKRIHRSIVLLITTLANIVLTVLWIEHYGILGACIATAVSTLLGQILLMDIYYAKKMNINILSFKKSVFRGIIDGQIIASIIAMLVGMWITNIWLSFFIGGIIFVALFFCYFYFFGSTHFEKNKINEYAQRLFFKVLKRNS